MIQVFIFLTLINFYLNSCFCCSRSKRIVEEYQDKMEAFNNKLFQNIEKLKNDSFETIATIDRSYCVKEKFYCYNDGICLIKLIELNKTYTERLPYCQCSSVLNFYIFFQLNKLILFEIFYLRDSLEKHVELILEFLKLIQPY